MTTDYHIRRAKRRVNRKKGFYFHLASFVIVNAFLMLLNILTTNRIWFIFPLASWGVGLAFHYVGVFGIPGFGVLSKEWEEKEMERELRKMGMDDESFEISKSKKSSRKMNMDEHLELKELRKNYDDSEFV
ncbi:2TM domain-containing protein [Saprospiraceae bacterium]|jgi:hypothetical protein|nr:2TM domain-containing protein [Bacteroidota bacterium]MDB4727823.1 2TM domain-containing protein [Saprospiraceae bacterium]MDF1867039.1 2TM domain-containing protein [Saprospiraceae bacterium]